GPGGCAVAPARSADAAVIMVTPLRDTSGRNSIRNIAAVPAAATATATAIGAKPPRLPSTGVLISMSFVISPTVVSTLEGRKGFSPCDVSTKAVGINVNQGKGPDAECAHGQCQRS